MQPYEVKLAFRTRSWMTVPLELGHDEIGDTRDTVPFLADDLVGLFEQLGLDRPEPVQILAPHHQIAQKLHACTLPDSERAHDLVDLQLLVADAHPDLALVGYTARRLFEFRKAQAWPPRVTAGPDWVTLYGEQAEGLAVLTDLDEAVDWANQLIADLNAATSSSS
jgi:hypothetical protein